jgi:hypothetical protein
MYQASAKVLSVPAVAAVVGRAERDGVEAAVLVGI